MPRWVARVVWAMRGKRRVRLHFLPDVAEQSIDGVLLGCWGGHYVLQLPRLVEAEDRSVPLEGMVEVARERVLFVQVLA